MMLWLEELLGKDHPAMWIVNEEDVYVEFAVIPLKNNQVRFLVSRFENYWYLYDKTDQRMRLFAYSCQRLNSNPINIQINHATPEPEDIRVVFGKTPDSVVLMDIIVDKFDLIKSFYLAFVQLRDSDFCAGQYENGEAFEHFGEDNDPLSEVSSLKIEAWITAQKNGEIEK
jgi:hypothetical protein